MKMKSLPSGGLFFVLRCGIRNKMCLKPRKIPRFGATIAYTCSKSMKKSEIWSNYKGVPQYRQNQFSAFLSFCLQFSLPLRVDRKTNLVYVREFGYHPDLQGKGEH